MIKHWVTDNICVSKLFKLVSNHPWQMTSSDKDFRFMATNDLMAELQKDSIKLDDDSERKVSKAIFQTFFF